MNASACRGRSAGRRAPAARGASRRRALSSTVAPGFTARRRSRVVSAGSSVQRSPTRLRWRRAGHRVVRPARVGRPSGGRRAARPAASCARARPAGRRPPACRRSRLPRTMPAAEHQQAAAARVDELADHPQLVAREEAGLDAAQDQPAVAKSSSRVLGKPPTSSSASSTPSRRNLLSAVRCRTTS